MNSFAVVRLIFLTAGLALMAGPACAGEKTLTVGDPAPELRVSRWVKGGPVAQLEKGHVYVVEFWATWCGYCIAAMPHLSDLSRKYAGKATIVSVDVWEHAGGRPPYDKKVNDFVEKKGRDMDYNVCRDLGEGPTGFMAHNWLDAALMPGIPAVFVIDRKGVIAWIGNAGKGHGLDEAIAQVLDGTFDYKASATQAAADQARNQPMIETRDNGRNERQKLEAMIAAGEWMQASDFILNLQARHPEQAHWESFKFQPLLHLDEPRGLQIARDNLAKGNNYVVYQASVIGSAEGLSRGAYEFAIPILETELAKPAPTMARNEAGLAAAYFHTGQVAKAVQVQEKLLAKSNPDNTPAEVLEKYRQALKRYQAAAK